MDRRKKDTIKECHYKKVMMLDRSKDRKEKPNVRNKKERKEEDAVSSLAMSPLLSSV